MKNRLAEMDEMKVRYEEHFDLVVEFLYPDGDVGDAYRLVSSDSFVVLGSNESTVNAKKMLRVEVYCTKSVWCRVVLHFLMFCRLDSHCDHGCRRSQAHSQSFEAYKCRPRHILVSYASVLCFFFPI